MSSGTDARGPHDRQGNSAESSFSASLPQTAQLLAALYNFLLCPEPGAVPQGELLQLGMQSARGEAQDPGQPRPGGWALTGLLVRARGRSNGRKPAEPHKHTYGFVLSGG